MGELVMFPRLPALAARLLLASVTDAGPDAARLRLEAAGLARQAGTGRLVREEELDALRRGLVRLAEACGFPGRSGPAAKAAFDAATAEWLIVHGPVPFAEALRDDVWTWLSTALMADVCAWRFEDRPAERFLGGVRNTLQRLWLRGSALDRGKAHPDRWGLLRQLSEDAMVQITERPGLAGDSRVAHAIAESWADTATRVPAGFMQELARLAIRNIHATNEVICLSALDDAALGALCQGAFSAASGAVAGAPTPGLASALSPLRPSLEGGALVPNFSKG